MCTVSMVMDWGHKQWPQPQQFPPALYPGYQELLEKAKKYDELMKQKDCPDPVKEAWHKQLEEFMREKYGLEPK